MKRGVALLVSTMSALLSNGSQGLIASSPKRGVFIVFEGIDRCGKTTQCNLLVDYLKSKSETEFIRFPNRTSCIGQLINSYLASATDINDNTIHLLFSANRWESKEGITEKLDAGCSLVCDRYAYSGVAFSSAKGMDFEWCKSCDRGLPAPDCVLFLDMPVEAAAQRGNYGEERYEKVDFQIKVKEKFMKLKADDENVVPWFSIAADRSIEEVHGEIKSVVDRIIENSKEKSAVPKLWI